MHKSFYTAHSSSFNVYFVDMYKIRLVLFFPSLFPLPPFTICSLECSFLLTLTEQDNNNNNNNKQTKLTLS